MTSPTGVADNTISPVLTQPIDVLNLEDLEADFQVFPARTLSVSSERRPYKEIWSTVNKLLDLIEGMNASSPDISDEVFVDSPDDFTYQSAYKWKIVPVELTPETTREIRFDGDEYRDVWF
jgi:hypothetical protein